MMWMLPGSTRTRCSEVKDGTYPQTKAPLKLKNFLEAYNDSESETEGSGERNEDNGNN